MTLEVTSVPELVGPNHLASKRKMIGVLSSKNIRRLVNGEHKEPAYAQVMIKWEKSVIKQEGSLVKQF